LIHLDISLPSATRANYRKCRTRKACCTSSLSHLRYQDYMIFTLHGFSISIAWLLMSLFCLLGFRKLLQSFVDCRPSHLADSSMRSSVSVHLVFHGPTIWFNYKRLSPAVSTRVKLADGRLNRNYNFGGFTPIIREGIEGLADYPARPFLRVSGSVMWFDSQTDVASRGDALATLAPPSDQDNLTKQVFVWHSLP